MLLGPYTLKPLMVALGYLWPAYQTYKTVASNNPLTKVKAQEYWCQYWLILGFYLAVEWIADAFVFWLPLYHEAKLLFILFLWHPRTQGAAVMYERVLKPLLQKHEASIDSVLSETQARLADATTRQIDRAKSAAVGNASTLLDNLRTFSEGTRPNLPGHSHRD